MENNDGSKTENRNRKGRFIKGNSAGKRFGKEREVPSYEKQELGRKIARAKRDQIIDLFSLPYRFDMEDAKSKQQYEKLVKRFGKEVVDNSNTWQIGNLVKMMETVEIEGHATYDKVATHGFGSPNQVIDVQSRGEHINAPQTPIDLSKLSNEQLDQFDTLIGLVTTITTENQDREGTEEV